MNHKGELAYRIAPGSTVRLADYPTEYAGGRGKDDGEQQLAALRAELNDLQYLMWGARTHAALIVIQGMDSAGKDGIINGVLSAINPQGLQITAFKVPTEEEAAHDFLWRVHASAPGKGIVGVYNRSQYEEVLVVRVHSLAPPEHIEAAYGLINDYERLLAEANTLIVKFYLHVSKDEQRKRLLARERDIVKAWKLSPGDWAERAHWDAYMAAYERALSRCSTDAAPWYVVPGDQKWAARLAVAQVLADLLRPHRADWLAALQKKQAAMLAALATVTKQ